MSEGLVTIPVPDHQAGGRTGSVIRRFLAALGADMALLLAFLIALAALVAAYGANFVWTEGPIVIAGCVGLGLVGVSLAHRLPAVVARRPGAWAAFKASARGIVRDWGPFTLLMWAFESLETYTGVIRKVAIDDQLYRMDLQIFGVEPTVWAGKVFHPLLTDWMSFAYGAYFVMPMILASALSMRGRRQDFREMSSAVVLQMGIGFVLFLLFPAGPPRYYAPLLNGGFDPPQLHSFFGLYEFQQGVFDTADPVRTRSAFPSLHCSLALLTLFYAHRFGDAVFGRRHPRLFFRLCFPIVVSLWLSTIYLRHHWIPDIAAGLVLGWMANRLAPVLRRRWPRSAEAPGLSSPRSAA
jgi:hypothetical protein